MPISRLPRLVLWKELTPTEVIDCKSHLIVKAKKTNDFEVCPKCAKACYGVYDRRVAKSKDAPLRGKLVVLLVEKRRFWCQACRKPFTEPIPGISKGSRTTHRFKRHVLWACENFADLKSVRRHVRCSSGYLYKTLYEQLDLQARKRRYPWPKNIGLDEHRFKRHPDKGFPIFASILVDHVNKRVFDLVEGRSADELNAALWQIPGRDNVQRVTIDLSPSYRSFVQSFFPRARIVADKFHVLRLLTPDMNRKRKALAGDRRSNPIGRLLLRNGKDLEFFERAAVHKWLEQHPELREIYPAKEALHGLYRVKGYDRAARAFTRFTDRLGNSKVREIKRLRRTLISWRSEILEYFRCPLSNGRTEGYNGKAKLIRRRAYGYRSFKNYRLRVLKECA